MKEIEIPDEALYRPPEDSKPYGRYLAAMKDGRIFSRIYNRYLTQNGNDRGYVKLKIRGITINAHRVVALSWIPNPDNLPQVNHKNGIRNDNRVCNLEWITQADNNKHQGLMTRKQNIHKIKMKARKRLGITY